MVKVPEQVKDEVSRIEGLLRQKGSSPQDIKAELKELMWKNAGPIRDERRLKEAISRLKEIRERVEEIKSSNIKELREALEVNFMLDVAEVMALSAFLRKESRSSHWRIDYPRPSRDWVKNVFIFRNNKGRIEVKVKDVELKRIKPKGPFKVGERHTWCYIIM